MVRDKANPTRTLIKRYISVNESDEHPQCATTEGPEAQRGLPFYDAVRKNVNMFDMGTLRSHINKLRAIGFESWRGVTSGYVSSFRNRFENGFSHKKIGETGESGLRDINLKTEANADCADGGASEAVVGESNIFSDFVVQPTKSEVDGDDSISAIPTNRLADKPPTLDVRSACGCSCDNQPNQVPHVSGNFFTSTLQTVLQHCFKPSTLAKMKQPPPLPKKRKKSGSRRQTSATTANEESVANSVCAEGTNECRGTSGEACDHAPSVPVTSELVEHTTKRAKQTLLPNGKVAVGLDLVLLPPSPLQGFQLVRWRAESKKEEGNSAYKRKAYREAVELYTEAIDLCPTYAAYYGNRAACYMMTGNYAGALEDCRQAVKFDDSFVKGYIREAKCHLALGDAAAARRSLAAVRALEPSNSSLLAEFVNIESFQLSATAAQNHYQRNDYRSALYHLDCALSHAVACTQMKLCKAECLVFLGRHQEAQDIAYDIMRADGTNADAIYVRGLSLYYQDMVDKAFTHFQQVLRYAPDHSRAAEIYRRAKNLKQKKEEGNEAFRNGRSQEAYDLYSQALLIDPNNVFTNAKLYFNRALVSAKLTKHSQAIEDCTQAIVLDENYVKAYLKRAKCYMDVEMYEEAVRDYEKICKLDKTREHKQLLQEAKLELKKSKRKDYYKILSIARNATEDEIKKAYRKRAMEHHPDRHANATADVKKEQEKKFKELGEAYSILSDPKKKSRYDCGQDLDDYEGGCDFDPYNIFQTFYGSPTQFQFTSGGNRPGFPGGSNASGFPGGFSFKFA